MSQTGPQALSAVLSACVDLDAQSAILSPLLSSLLSGPSAPVTAIQTDTKTIRDAALNLQALLGNCTAANAAATQAAAANGLLALTLQSADLVVQQGLLEASSSGWSSDTQTKASAPLAAIQKDALEIQNAVGDLQAAFTACGTAAAGPGAPVPAPFPNAPAPAPSAGLAPAWTTAIVVAGVCLGAGLLLRALHKPVVSARA